MEEQLQQIKTWLGTGSVNVFGLPMSGKDTVGVELAEKIGAKFLSSGIIVRAMEQSSGQSMTKTGQLIPTNIFYEWVLPYFEKPELRPFPLILSSVGRWAGEEDQVISVAEAAGHPIKAVVMLQLSEQDVMDRFEAAKILGDRGLREDDANPEILRTRIEEYRVKTLPVLQHYQELGLLIPVRATASREQVFANVVEALAKFAASASNVVAKL